MRTIAHISDIHFGREDELVVEGLIASIAAAQPDVVVVSGDLTQRARKKQFRAARAFLERLPRVPQLVVPGNHDISLSSMVDRAFKPFDRFRHYITPDLEPFYEDDELAIAGINTVRRSTVNDGKIKKKAVRIACLQLASADPAKMRIVVTHHPMDILPGVRSHRVVAKAKSAMKQFGAVGVDLFLSGHLHTGRTLDTSTRYKLNGYSAVVVHAGTAVSTRRRGQANSWNVVRVGVETIEVQPMEWNETAFTPMPLERYVKREGGWRPAGLID